MATTNPNAGPEPREQSDRDVDRRNRAPRLVPVGDRRRSTADSPLTPRSAARPGSNAIGFATISRDAGDHAPGVRIVRARRDRARPNGPCACESRTG